MAPVALLRLSTMLYPLNCGHKSPSLVAVKYVIQPGDWRGGHAAKESSEDVAAACLKGSASDNIVLLYILTLSQSPFFVDCVALEITGQKNRFNCCQLKTLPNFSLVEIL